MVIFLIGHEWIHNLPDNEHSAILCLLMFGRQDTQIPRCWAIKHLGRHQTVSSGIATPMFYIFPQAHTPMN